jgi:hypothetical protein
MIQDRGINLNSLDKMKTIAGAEEMSLYDIVSKKNYKIILYTYACILYYLRANNYSEESSNLTKKTE